MCKTAGVVLIVLVNLFEVEGKSGEITDSEHRTKAAIDRVADLWCYRCDTMVDGEKCMDLNDNSSLFHNKCTDQQRICQVKKISLTTITSSGDMTGKQKLWMLQRNCTESCDPGCIIIGERTKLHSCITCCEHSYCNHGNGALGRIGVRKYGAMQLVAMVLIVVVEKYVQNKPVLGLS